MMRLPSQLDCPAFLMSPPFTVGNSVHNNAWVTAETAPYDLPRAFFQWMALYHRLASEGVVYLLPAEGEFQDRPFVADIAAALPHRPDCVVISRIETPGRIGEELVAERFFEQMGYTVHRSPFRWEGSSELKYLCGRTYIGGVGQRSSAEAFEWIAESFDAEVITVNLTDPKAYHLDSVLFPLTDKAVLMATSLFDKEDVRKIEAIAEIIDVPPEHVFDGWTNVVRLPRRVIPRRVILHNPQSEQSVVAFAKVLYRRDFDLELMDVSEMEKSGADLSCCVMSLNRAAFS